MPTVSAPLQNLAQRINQQEIELAKLREEFELRQAQLTELTRRKEELQAQLQQVESEIQSVGQIPLPKPVVSTPPARQEKPTASISVAKSAKRVTLAKFLINWVQRAKKPVTSKELADEIVRSKYPTTSSNIRQMVDTRVGELVKKGIFSRDGAQPGVVLGNASATASPVAEKTSTDSKNGHAKRNAKPSGAGKAITPKAELSLAALLTQVLGGSSRPMSTNELAEQVLKCGYETKSKDFKNVIWSSISQMKNIERVPGEGYRLKKGKASGAKRKS